MADDILAGPRASDPVVVPEAVTAVDEMRRVASDAAAWRAAVGVAAVTFVLLVAVGRRATAIGPRAIASASTTRGSCAFAGDAGELAMASRPGEPGAVLLGSGLPDPGPDKVYEIWMIQDGTPVSGGCVRPQDGQVADVRRREPRYHRGDGRHGGAGRLSIESLEPSPSRPPITVV